MFKIYENDIALTRGDTLETNVEIIKDGEVYTPTAGDVVRFSVKRKEFTNDGYDFVDQVPLIDIEIPSDMVLVVEPQHTEFLGFGVYHYDIDITMEDGYKSTFVSGDLIILPKSDERLIK